MLNLFKKTLAVCLIGFGIGILLVILLPLSGWLFIIGSVVVCVGLAWLCCWTKNSIYKMNQKIKESVVNMTIVVKKVPKFLRGFVKLIFGVK